MFQILDDKLTSLGQLNLVSLEILQNIKKSDKQIKYCSFGSFSLFKSKKKMLNKTAINPVSNHIYYKVQQKPVCNNPVV